MVTAIWTAATGQSAEYTNRQSVLKQYLIKGYVINQQIKLDRYNELKDVVRFRRIQYLHF
ncbi:MAG: hypothetical protein EGQ52_01465 [Prevotella sp.]|nr:hypothetical protein [Prevotella sp.]